MRNRRSRRTLNTPTKKTKILIFILLCTIILLIFILIHQHNTTKNIAVAENFQENIVSTENNAENSINPENHPPEEQPKSEDITFTMALTGDIMCHNTMYQDAYESSTDSYNFEHFFENIKYYLQTADLTIGNLETTFAGKARGYSSYPTFNTPESLARTLKKVGFDVVSTANNHCYDKGYTGLVSTLNYLDEADLSHTGTYASSEDQSKILVNNVKGVKIAFLSFTYGTNGITVPADKTYSVNLIDKDLILNQLSLAKEQNVDMICVSMHWGQEYQTTPNSTQKELTEFLFKNGADLIIGNHPHVLQPMEKQTITLEDGSTKECFVIYSLGNFMADQNKAYTRDSVILNLKITKNAENGKITFDSATYTPTYIYKDTTKSSKKFKILDIESTIAAFDADYDTSIGTKTYNTLKTELQNIKNIIGEEL